MEKLCVFCKNFKWEAIEYTYYSTLTGGDLEGGLDCARNHFSVYHKGRPESTEDFRKVILIAQQCPDYEPDI